MHLSVRIQICCFSRNEYFNNFSSLTPILNSFLPVCSYVASESLAPSSKYDSLKRWEPPSVSSQVSTPPFTTWKLESPLTYREEEKDAKEKNQWGHGVLIREKDRNLNWRGNRWAMRSAQIRCFILKLETKVLHVERPGVSETSIRRSILRNRVHVCIIC